MCNSCIWVCITNLSMCSFCRYWHPYRRGRTKQKCTTLKCIRWCSWKYSRNKNKCLSISRHLIFVFLIIAFIICSYWRPLKIIWYSWPLGVHPHPPSTQRKNPRGHEYQSSFKTAVLPFLLYNVTNRWFVWWVSSIVAQINVASVLTWLIWLIWQGRWILCFHLFSMYSL
jgi:hypothetical protein